MTICEMLSMYTLQGLTDWVEYLPAIGLQYNAMVSFSTGKLPFEIVYRSEAQLSLIWEFPQNSPVKPFATLWSEAKLAIEKAQGEQKAYTNTHRMDSFFAVGDYILMAI